MLAKHFNTPTESYSLTSLKYDFEENFDCGEIIFVLVTQLNIPAVEVVPSMEEVQTILVAAGKNTIYFTVCISFNEMFFTFLSVNWFPKAL